MRVGRRKWRFSLLSLTASSELSHTRLKMLKVKRYSSSCTVHTPKSYGKSLQYGITVLRPV